MDSTASRSRLLANFFDGGAMVDVLDGSSKPECPGYCGAQDTFYVGTLKGVGPRLSANLHRYLCEGLASPSSMIASRLGAARYATSRANSSSNCGESIA